MPAEQRKPFWLYPNLLSMDAPLVAVSWLYLFAKTWRLGYHPWEAYVSLGLVVWGIYMTDRLLDVSLRGASTDMLAIRHQFHQRHQRVFRGGVIAAFTLALLLVLTKIPMTIYKHLLFGGVLVAGFFGLSMLTYQAAREVPLTKNVLAGLAFAFGTAMMAHLYRWEYGIYDLLASREFVCFAVLCILNISAIDLWENASRSVDLEIHASHELSLTLPLILLGAASLVFALLDYGQAARPFYYAILTGSALLYIINRLRSQFSMDTLRVLANLALLVPVLVFLAAAGE